MEAPHSFRKQWPKKKARANREARRRLDALLRGEADPTAAQAKVALGPHVVRKGLVKNLREFIDLKRFRRNILVNRRRDKKARHAAPTPAAGVDEGHAGR